VGSASKGRKMKRIELPSNKLVMYAFGECHLENRSKEEIRGYWK
nr:hypothetical protein [Tanacetum cinerariifolium]